MKAAIVSLTLFAAGTSAAYAGDIVIPLAKTASVERLTEAFHCDAEGVKMGLPAGPFIVEYINGGDNSLAVLPIHDKPLIFSNVFAADGARYAAGRYVWWDARGRSITLSAETTDGHKQSDCQPAEKQ